MKLVLYRRRLLMVAGGLGVCLCVALLVLSAAPRSRLWPARMSLLRRLSTIRVEIGPVASIRDSAYLSLVALAPDSLPTIRAMMESQEPAERFYGCGVLRRVLLHKGDLEATQLLAPFQKAIISCLSEAEDPFVRRSALGILRYSTATARANEQAVLTALKSPNKFERRTAINICVNQFGRGDFALEGVRQDLNSELNADVICALNTIHSLDPGLLQLTNEVERLLSSTNRAIRFIAADVLLRAHPTHAEAKVVYKAVVQSEKEERSASGH